MLVLLRKYWLRDVTLVTLLTLRLLLLRWAVGTRVVLLLARVCWWMDDFLTELGICIGVRLNNAGFAHIRSRDASVTTCFN